MRHDIVKEDDAALTHHATMYREDDPRHDELRFRQFGDHSPDTLWMIDAASGRLEYLSPAFERVWGEPRDRMMNDVSRWNAFVHPDDRARVGDALSRLIAGEPVTAEYRIRRGDGSIRWIRDVGFAMLGGNGRVERVAGIAHDFTESRQVEEALRDSERRARMLLEELQHRARNTLAVIRSVSRRTAAASETMDDFAAHLDGRIGALSRAQASATRDVARGMDLRALIDDELLAAAAGQYGHVQIDGPDIRLRAKVGETLTLAIHELATNSLKYGALSEGGDLSITWREDGESMTLEWVERLSPRPALEPLRRGFGTELLEQTLAYEVGADVSFDVGQTAVRCVIQLPDGYAAGENIAGDHAMA